jgi:hypothetical protein
MQWVQDPSKSNVDNLNNVDMKLAEISGGGECISES